jgi:hypothetical protein
VNLSGARIGRRILDARTDAGIARAAAARSDSPETAEAAIRLAEELELFADSCVAHLAELNGRASGRPPV